MISFKACKIVSALFIMSSLSSFGFIHSLSLNEAYAAAYSASEEYRTGSIALNKTWNSAYLKELESRDSFSFGLRNAKSGFRDDDYLSGTLFVDYSTQTDDPFSLKMTMPSNLTKSSDDIYAAITPSIQLSKTFDLSGVKSLETQLSLEKSYKVALSNIQAYDLRFQMKFLQVLQSCIRSLSSLIKASNSSEKLSREYQNDISLGTLTQGSLLEKERLSALTLSQVSLQNAKIAYENSKKNFFSTTGLEFEALFDDEFIDSILNYDLPQEAFEIKDEGNIDCVSLKYDMLIAQNKYMRLKKGSEKLKSSLSAEYRTSINSPIKTNAISIDGTLEYQSALCSLGIGGGVDCDLPASSQPHINFSFAFSPDKTYQKDILDSIQKLYDYQKASLDYSIALNDYYNKAVNMQLTCANAKNTLASSRLTFEYAKLKWENSQELFDLGYKSQNDISSDEVSYKDAKNTYILSALDVIINELEAEILNL